MIDQKRSAGSQSDEPELRKQFIYSEADLLDVCTGTGSAGLKGGEGDSHWGHMSHDIHGARESQEGPEQ